MGKTYHHGDKAQEKLFKSEWHWLKNEPKEWRRLYKHKKRRAELKRSLLKPDQENTTYPLDKKPHIYYY